MQRPRRSVPLHRRRRVRQEFFAEVAAVGVRVSSFSSSTLEKDGIASLTDCEDLRQVTTVPGYFALDKVRVKLVDQLVFFQTSLKTKTGSI